MMGQRPSTASCFNEAGPVKGRKPAALDGGMLLMLGRFNEAGPVKGRKRKHLRVALRAMDVPLQ